MLLTYCTVIGVVSSLQFVELKVEDEELTNLLQSVDHAKHTSESYVIYNKIFSSIDDKTLNQLTHHENKSISIRSAWERLESQLGQQLKKGRIKNKNFMVGQFCGIVEAQAQCTIPRWWCDAILKIKMKEEYCEFPKISFVNKLSNRVAVVGADATKLDNGQILISKVDSERVQYTIPSKMLSEHISLGTISVSFGDDNIYLALAPDFCFSYRIRAIDFMTENVKWTSYVWSAQSVGGTTGAGSGHMVSIVPTKDYVVVFGRGELHIYVEAFDIKNGSVIFRFCNTI